MADPPPPIDYATPASAPRPSAVATAALACGIVGLFVPLVGVAAIAIGLRGVHLTRRSELGGRERATVGLWLGVVGTLVWAALVAFLILVIGEARQSGTRGSSRNLRQIGLAIMLYTNENAGDYPPDFPALLRTQDLTLQNFVSPTGPSRPAETPWTSDAAARAAGNLDFVYVGERLTSAAGAVEPVAIELPAVNGGSGANVLFADGHVEWLPRTQVLTLLQPLVGTPRLDAEEAAALNR